MDGQMVRTYMIIMTHQYTMIVRELCFGNYTKMSLNDMTNIKRTDTVNNESYMTGIIAETDGTFTAITATASRNVKRFVTAKKWLASRGIYVSEAIQAR